MDNDFNYITTSTCDCCERGPQPVVVLHTHGVPVLGECATCAPEAFESTARQDIDRWLSGEEVWFGR